MRRFRSIFVGPAVALIIIAPLLTVMGCSSTQGSQPAATEAAGVPNVVGLTQLGACTLLERQGFASGQITTEAAPAGGDAKVVSQSPAADTPSPAGAKVDLVIAVPAEPLISVPNLISGKRA